MDETEQNKRFVIEERGTVINDGEDDMTPSSAENSGGVWHVYLMVSLICVSCTRICSARVSNQRVALQLQLLPDYGDPNMDSGDYAEYGDGGLSPTGSDSLYQDEGKHGGHGK